MAGADTGQGSLGAALDQDSRRKLNDLGARRRQRVYCDQLIDQAAGEQRTRGLLAQVSAAGKFRRSRSPDLDKPR
jgi:hypothetical protein